MSTDTRVRRGFLVYCCVLGCAAAMAVADPAAPAEATEPSDPAPVVSGNPTEPVSVDDAPVAAPTKPEAAPEPGPTKKLLLPGPPTKAERAKAMSDAAATVVDDVPIPPAPQESLPLGGSPSDAMELGSSTPLLGDSEAKSVGSGGWALQTLSALAVVIALIFGLRVLLQRITGQSPVGPASRVVEVLARTTIAPKSSVILLKVGGSVLAVGHTPSGLSTLAEFDDPGDVASLLSQVSASKPLSITESFRSVLHGADAGYDDESGEVDEAASDRTHEQVNGLLARMRSFGKRDSA